jgi:hypothetical protein
MQKIIYLQQGEYRRLRLFGDYDQQRNPDFPGQNILWLFVQQLPAEPG